MDLCMGFDGLNCKGWILVSDMIGLDWLGLALEWIGVGFNGLIWSWITLDLFLEDTKNNTCNWTGLGLV